MGALCPWCHYNINPPEFSSAVSLFDVAMIASLHILSFCSMLLGSQYLRAGMILRLQGLISVHTPAQPVSEA